MKARSYSSLTAFLAHLRALGELSSPSQEQAVQLHEMQALMEALSQRERQALQTPADSGSAMRERQRAERHLGRILRERGILADGSKN